MSSFRSKLEILGRQQRPFRFLAARLLARSPLRNWTSFARPGYRLRLHPAALSMTLWERPHDREADSRIVQRLLRPGDCFVDVGANIGHLTIEAAIRVGREGCVCAFEAHPRTCGFLRENVALNDLQNVRVANAAVGEAGGWVRFEDGRNDDQNAVASDGGFWVPAVTLDSLCEDLRATLLKIDVEGFELPVLRGAVRLLERTKYIYFEAWKYHFQKYGYEFRDIWKFLDGAGFRVMREDARGELTEISYDYDCGECVNLLAMRETDAQEFLSSRAS